MNAADEAMVSELWEAGCVRKQRTRVCLADGTVLWGRAAGVVRPRGAEGGPAVLYRTGRTVRVLKGEDIVSFTEEKEWSEWTE